MTIGESTNGHLSLGRGIWCGTQLNTNATHDIPLAMSGLARRQWRAWPGRLSDAMHARRYARAGAGHGAENLERARGLSSNLGAY